SEVVNHQTGNYYISHHREYFTRIIRFTGKQLYPIYVNPYSPKVCETYIRPLYMRIKPSESKVFIILINFTLVNLIASLSNLVAITYSRLRPFELLKVIYRFCSLLMFFLIYIYLMFLPEYDNNHS